MGMVYLIYMNDHEWLIVIGCYWYIPYIHGSVMGPHSIPRFCARNCGTTNIAQQWCGTGWCYTQGCCKWRFHLVLYHLHLVVVMDHLHLVVMDQHHLVVVYHNQQVVVQFPDPKWHLRLNNLGKKPDRSWATPALCETSSASLGSIFPLESVVVFFLEKNHEFFHWIVLTFCKCGQLFRHHVLIWRFWR